MAGALGAVFDEMPRLKVASFFAGAVDGMARAAGMLGLLEAQFARCDSDPAILYYWERARVAKEHRFDWGDIEAVPRSQLQATMESINLLLVSPPCGDWSRAGKQLRGAVRRGSWFLKWPDVSQSALAQQDDGLRAPAYRPALSVFLPVANQAYLGREVA